MGIKESKYWGLSFAEKLFSGMKYGSIQVCAAWTIGSLVVMWVPITRDISHNRSSSMSRTKSANGSPNSSFIFVLTVFIKPSSTGTGPHDLISSPILTKGQPADSAQKWLDELSLSVKPRACHSHNDYLRPYPLFSALAAGCSSVEADVWRTEDGTDLMVGHDEASLTADRTLTSMYFNPLVNIVDRITAGSEGPGGLEPAQPRGVFRTKPHTTLVLLIDVKTRSSETWPLVVEQLSSMRDKKYLTRFENGILESGPITIVGTGNIASDQSVFISTGVDPTRPFDQYHDTFLDAPLASLPQPADILGNGKAVSSPPDEAEQTWTNKTAYYASASFKTTIGSVIMGFSPSQLSTLRTQIAAAAKLGLKSRYWDTPDWSMAYRDYVWSVLEREGVGVLNVDDLEGFARGDWDAIGRAWAREVVWMISIGVLAVCCGVTVGMLGWKRTRWVATKPVDYSS